MDIVCITGHRENTIYEHFNQETKEQKKSIINSLLYEFQSILVELFPKRDNVIFNIGGSDGFDNLFGLVLLKNGYLFDLYIPTFDINGRKYWNQKNKDLFNNLKDNQRNLYTINGNYLKRNDQLIQNSKKLLGFYFKRNKSSGTGYTINKWKQKNTKYYEILVKDYVILV